MEFSSTITRTRKIVRRALSILCARSQMPECPHPFNGRRFLSVSRQTLPYSRSRSASKNSGIRTLV